MIQILPSPHDFLQGLEDTPLDLGEGGMPSPMPHPEVVNNLPPGTATDLLLPPHCKAKPHAKPPKGYVSFKGMVLENILMHNFSQDHKRVSYTCQFSRNGKPTKNKSIGELVMEEHFPDKLCAYQEKHDEEIGREQHKAVGPAGQDARLAEQNKRRASCRTRLNVSSSERRKTQR